MHRYWFNLVSCTTHKSKALTKLVGRLNESSMYKRSWFHVPPCQFALGKLQSGTQPSSQCEEFSPFLPHIHLPVLHANVWLVGEVGPHYGYLYHQFETHCSKDFFPPPISPPAVWKEESSFCILACVVSCLLWLGLGLCL